jgi:hypothetical protein
MDYNVYFDGCFSIGRMKIFVETLKSALLNLFSQVKCKQKRNSVEKTISLLEIIKTYFNYSKISKSIIIFNKTTTKINQNFATILILAPYPIF